MAQPPQQGRWHNKRGRKWPTGKGSGRMLNAPLWRPRDGKPRRENRQSEERCDSHPRHGWNAGHMQPRSVTTTKMTPQTSGNRRTAPRRKDSVWGMVEFKSRQESNGASIEASHRRLHETRRSRKKDARTEKRKRKEKKDGPPQATRKRSALQYQRCKARTLEGAQPSARRPK